MFISNPHTDIYLSLCFKELNPCRQTVTQANEREYVLNALVENDYPKRFLNDCLRPPVCMNQNNSEDDTSAKGYAIVPDIRCHRTNQENDGVTEPIKRTLK